MIDGDEIRMLIEKRRPFKIGTRGICIICSPIKDIYDRPLGWTIMIPRAFVGIDATDISVLDDVDFYHFTFQTERNGPYHSLADLTQYDKVTVLL